MRMPAMLAPGFGALAALAGPACAQPVADPIELVPIACRTFAGGVLNPWLPDPRRGTPASTHGVLCLPAASGRVPPIVLLHGCGGVGESGTEWARWLRDLGYAALIVDSFPRCFRATRRLRSAVVPASLLR